MRQPLLNARTDGPVLFSKQIMTSKHALLSFQIHSFQRDHKFDVSERLKTLKPTTMNLGCPVHRVPNGETIKKIILPILPLYDYQFGLMLGINGTCIKRSVYSWTVVTPCLLALTGALRLLRPTAPLCSHWTGDSSQTVSPCGVARLQGDTFKWKKGDRKRYLPRTSQLHRESNCETTKQHFCLERSARQSKFTILPF